MTSETEKMPELKPCPFCGSSAEIMWIGSMFSVECNNNNCTVKPNAIDFDEEQAIEAWNIRAAVAYPVSKNDAKKALIELRRIASYDVWHKADDLQEQITWWFKEHAISLEALLEAAAK